MIFFESGMRITVDGKPDSIWATLRDAYSKGLDSVGFVGAAHGELILISVTHCDKIVSVQTTWVDLEVIRLQMAMAEAGKVQQQQQLKQVRMQNFGSKH